MQGRVNSCLASLGEHDSDHDPLENAAAHGEEQHVSDRDEDECVLIMAPLGKDATAMAALLYADGFEVQICAGADECSRQIAARRRRATAYGGSAGVPTTFESFGSP